MYTKGNTIDFIGIGASKCATSWVAKCLSEHPEICMHPEKETHFFSKRYDEGVGSYLAEFSNCGERQLRGEFSTSYLHDAETAHRIHAHFPDTRLIVCLRDPVGRFFSFIRGRQAKGKIARGTDTVRLLQQDAALVSYMEYTSDLQRYYDLFDEKRILVLLYDDLEQNPHKEVQKLFNFLGVDSSFIPSCIGQKYNTSAARSSPFFGFVNRVYIQLRKTLPGRWLVNSLRQLGITGFTVESYLQFLKFGKTTSGSRQERNVLRKMFMSDIIALEQHIKRDLSKWKQYE